MFKFALALILVFTCCISTLMASDGSDLVSVQLFMDASDSSEALPFVQIGRKLYLIEGEQRVDWFEAAHICRSYKSQLASVESSAEIEALSRYLVENGHKDKWLWLSGNDLSKEGSFAWLGTGNAIRYAKWSGGQPDNAGGNENCVHLWVQGNTFYMNDWLCNQKTYYICEKIC